MRPIWRYEKKVDEKELGRNGDIGRSRKQQKLDNGSSANAGNELRMRADSE